MQWRGKKGFAWVDSKTRSLKMNFRLDNVVKICHNLHVGDFHGEGFDRAMLHSEASVAWAENESV